METLTSSIDNDRLEAEMINRLTKTDAHFKHQQRGEPDLTCEEKSTIAYEIFKKSPALFLERFSQFLTLDDIGCFKRFHGNYQVDFYIKEIDRRCADTSKNLVKNRRYQALKVLMDGGDYFSEDEMKWRDPLLYEQMEEEEEEEEEDEESNEEINDNDPEENNKEQHEINDRVKEEEISSVEKAYLRTEFLRIMQERFLSGDDFNFDYSKVDSNADYDALDIVGHDAEEKYFDDDGELSEEGDCGGDSSLRKKMECIGLENRVDDDCQDDDYMNFVPSEDTSNKDS